LSGGATSIAVDSLGYPHIAYYDGSAHIPKYAKWTGSSWAIETVGTDTGLGMNLAIALDSAQVPNITVYDHTHGEFFYYHKHGTSGWDSFHLSTPDVFGSFNSIAIASNFLHIAFCNETVGGVMYASGTFVTDLSPYMAVTGYGCRDTSIKADTSGNVHLSFYGTSNNHLMYAKRAGTTWTAQVVDSSGNVGQYSSIALDSSGNPVISYYDATYNALKFAKWDGSSWSIQTVDTTQGQYTSVAVDSANKAHIAYGSSYLKLANETDFQAAGKPSLSARTASSLTWSWTDNSPNETGYRVRRVSDNTNLSGDLPANTVAWTRSGLGPNVPQQIYIENFNSTDTAQSPNSVVTYTLAQPPADTTAAAVYVTSVTLSWAGNGNPYGTVYEAESSSDNLVFTRFYSGTTSSADGSGLLSNSTYYFRVRAINGDGISTAYDTVLSTQTLQRPPLAPTGLAVSTRTTTSITWSWTDNATNELGYRLRRASDNVDLSGSLPANTTFWAQTGLESNSLQEVHVEAFRETSSSFSTSLSTVTLAVPPSGTYVSGATHDTVQIAWLSNGDAAGTTYRAAISTDGATFSRFYNDTALTATATGLAELTTYYFRVRALSLENIATAWDVVVSTKTKQTPPAAPTGLSVSGRTTSSISWSWTDNATNELGYRVRRSSDNTDLSGPLPANSASWTQPGLSPNEFQSVYVEAYRDQSQADSNATSAYASANPPTATAVAAVYYTSATVSWSDGGNPPGTVYRAETSPANVAYTELYAGTALFAAAVSLPEYATVFFRVRAENGDGIVTAYDAVVSTTTLEIPPAPPGEPTVSSRTTGSITWMWADNSTNEDYFVVHRSSDDADLSGSLPPGTTQWVQTGLGLDSAQQVYVEAYRSATHSDSTPSALVHTLVNPPSGATVSGLTYSSATLSWSANGDDPGTIYHAQRSMDGASYQDLYTGPSLFASITGLTSGTTYYFRVSAENSDGIMTSYATAAPVFALPPTITPAGGTFHLQTSHGPFVLDVPPSAFAQDTPFEVNLSPSFPPPNSPVFQIVGTGVGIEIHAPAGKDHLSRPASLSFGYTDADVSGLDETRLFIARSDSGRGMWVPVPSQVDPAGNWVTSHSDEFGLFQVMTLTPSTVVDTVKAWPNPLRPALAGNSQMTFSDLPAGVNLKIYTTAGELVAERTSNTVGIAEWNGRTDSGQRAASGVYLVRVAGPGGDKIIKVAVER